MKKNIFLYLALFFCLFSACKKDDPGPGGSPATRVAREVDDTGYYADYTYDSQDRLTKNEGLDYQVSLAYESNKVISDIIFDNGAGSDDTIHRVFTLQNGFASEQMRTYDDGSTGRFVYERNTANRVVKETQYDSNGIPTSIATSEYDASGNLSKTSYSNGSGVLIGVILNEYAGSVANTLHYGDEYRGPDAPLAVSKTTFLDANGAEISRYNYTYQKDTDGRIVKRTDKYFYAANPNQNSTRVNEYVYR